ncbi:MAG: tRNA lysidine(34) synthetase TilS [Actinobacteria bacterium]|nr:tRNA lysidine(34) synthetase TilS [Actinomycetota bacterium]MBU1494525.1 tRNA lysidine(34) synthetase TilS [Actinomycetota bacterium]
MAGAGRLTSSAASLLERVGGGFPSGPIAVALSGGADSAVCAWAAMAAGRQVRAITADHGLPESAALVAAAVEISAMLGLDHRVVAAGCDDTSEAGLRVARYAALEAAAAPGESLVSGHTADDQAETTLGNLLRGAGALGLAGIPSRRGRWHRPLLGESRAVVREAAVELGLPFADDPGNLDVRIRRSRIRTEVIPYLEQFNPSLRPALVRTAQLSADDEAALEGRASAVPIGWAAGEVRMAAAALAAVPKAVASRAVRRGLRMLLDPYAGDLSDVIAVLSVAAGEAPAASISTGLVAAREGPWVTIFEPGALPPPLEAVLPVPGDVRFGRWVIEADRVEAAPLPPLSRRVLALPSDHGRLLVRAARSGDTIAMGEGSKSVAEALREAGVPARLRVVWPVVTEAGRMVWVIGSRHAAGAAAEAGRPATVLRVREAK